MLITLVKEIKIRTSPAFTSITCGVNPKPAGPAIDSSIRNSVFNKATR